MGHLGGRNPLGLTDSNVSLGLQGNGPAPPGRWGHAVGVTGRPVGGPAAERPPVWQTAGRARFAAAEAQEASR